MFHLPISLTSDSTSRFSQYPQPLPSYPGTRDKKSFVPADFSLRIDRLPLTSSGPSRYITAMLLSPVQPLVAAYVMGLLAAMPIGPVNMIAIRRGVMWRWTHTLACGSGAAIGDLTLFCLALLGGRWLLPYLESGTVRIILAATGIAVLVPVGVLFLVRGFSLSLRAIARARRRLQDKPPQHFIVDVATGTALTLFNPLCAGYWGAATAGWLPIAKIYLGWAYFGWGLSMAGAGLMSWFLLLTVLVRFTPNRLGPVFFRYVNFVCGLILLGFGVFCGSLIVQTLRNHS